MGNCPCLVYRVESRFFVFILMSLSKKSIGMTGPGQDFQFGALISPGFAIPVSMHSIMKLLLNEDQHR